MRAIIKRFTGYIILIIVLFIPVYSFPETSSIIDHQDGPIEVRAETFDVDTRKSTITFSKDVEAVRNDIKINCQKLVLFYHMTSREDESYSTQPLFDKIEATEQVRVNRSDGSTLTAEKAVYYLDDNKVIITGNPVVANLKRGDGFAKTECYEITIDLKKGTYSFKGPEGGKVKSVILPPKKDRRQQN